MIEGLGVADELLNVLGIVIVLRAPVRFDGIDPTLNPATRVPLDVIRERSLRCPPITTMSYWLGASRSLFPERGRNPGRDRRLERRLIVDPWFNRYPVVPAKASIAVAVTSAYRPVEPVKRKIR